MPVESPCIRHCTLDATDICVGCGRTLDEICGWTRMADGEKAATRARAGERVAQRRSRASNSSFRSNP